jgi:hypothetical protein
VTVVIVDRRVGSYPQTKSSYEFRYGRIAVEAILPRWLKRENLVDLGVDERGTDGVALLIEQQFLGELDNTLVAHGINSFMSASTSR